MLKIGITGGIGSGKTTITKIFELLNIPIFYADPEAKALMVENESVVRQIKALFGNEAYFEDGTLNRKHIGDIAFKNAQILEKLNAITHPAVKIAYDNWCAKQKTPYVLKEAALLFESKSYLENDFNILVSSPLNLRIERVMKRDQTTKENVLERIAKQLPEEEKVLLADFIINNDEKELLIPQVLSLHAALLKKA